MPCAPRQANAAPAPRTPYPHPHPKAIEQKASNQKASTQNPSVKEHDLNANVAAPGGGPSSKTGLPGEAKASLPPFLAGGGQMGERIRSFDWAATDLGPSMAWPAGLRAVVQMMLTTRHPVFVFWGPQHLCLFNDAYSQTLGADKHPAILGRPGCEAWAEIWHIISPQIAQVMGGGEATWHDNHLVPMMRNGVVQETYWTYGYGPIGDDNAPHGVGGVLVLCNETTAQVLTQKAVQAAEERWRSLFEQTPGFVCILRGSEHRIEFVNPGFQQLLGGRPLIGLTAAQAIPEAAEQGFFSLLDGVYGSGEAFTATGRSLLLRDSRGTSEQRYIDFVYQPIVDNGRVGGIFVQGSDVTDSVRAHAALVESEARWRALAENLPGGAVFVVDRELRFVLAAGEALTASGLSTSDLVGRTVFEAIPPDRAAIYAAHYQQALAGEPFELEHQDDGHSYVTRGVPLRDVAGSVSGAMAMSYDISSRRVAEDRLRSASAQLDAVLSAAEIGMWSWHVQEDLVRYDLNLARLYGLPDAATMPLKQHFDRIHLDDRAAMQSAVDKALHSGYLYIREYRVVSVDGRVRWLAGRGALQRDAQGLPESLNGLVIDISDLKELEESLLASDRQKDRFLAILAHELRNPLAPLLGAAEMLGTESLGTAQLHWCRDIIQRQVRHMAVLLDDLLDVSGIRHGRLRVGMVDVALQDIVDAAVETALPLLQSRQQALQIEMPRPSLRMMADPGRMAQVLSNLLTNAAKYTPPGGQVRLVARRVGSDAEIKVHDNGIGLAAADISRIFEMFSRVEEVPAGNGGVAGTGPGVYGGLGIGLALVKGFVELHGGSVAAHSEGLGQGSVFTVSLAALPADEAAMSSPLNGATVQATPCRVLIADDNPDAAETLSMLLNLAGHSTRVAGDGQAALAACAEFNPQVALLDLGMPGLTGYEVAQQLRANPAHAGMVLVAVTGWGLEENRRLAREAGFNQYHTKPIDPDVLLRILGDASGPAAVTDAVALEALIDCGFAGLNRTGLEPARQPGVPAA